MNNEFISKYLTDVTYATDEQKSKELWDVSGILKNKSNRVFKFDTRHISTFDPINKIENEFTCR